MRFYFFVIGLFLFVGIVSAQNHENEMSGILSFDQYETHDLIELEENDYSSVVSKKSVFLAGLFSAVLPGAGEIYTENYLKAGIFLAIEAAAITAAVIYDQKGNDQTEIFENFANTHWSADRYAQWTYGFAEWAQANYSSMFPSISEADLTYFQNNLFTNGKVNYQVLNSLESKIGSYYSHKLDPFGSQQYYEMIGKYHQFNPGWDDAGNIPYQLYDPNNYTVSEKFKYYSGERNKANDFYSTAKTAVTIVILNHIISAVDAAWSASRYNKSLETKVSLEKQTVGFYTEYYPQLNLKVRF